MRIFQIDNQNELRKAMQDINVDSYGIDIMAPKAISHLIKIDFLSCIAANILKQEMLSLGGDVAIAREALTGKIKHTDCLLIANLSQYNRLSAKLNKQPFGLNKLGCDLSTNLANYQKKKFKVNLGKYKLDLGRRTYIMGIVNLTPDSFSGDGLYRTGGLENCRAGIVDYAEQLVSDGADIVDIGGESSRPGARAISVKEEISRTVPLVKILAKKIKVPISIDTYKPEVAKQALDNGAVMVNDVTGLRQPKMAKIIAKYKAGIVLMHMKGSPRNMQKNPIYESLISEIIGYLHKAIKIAISSGIDRGKIIVDPGIGFGKTLEHNLEILKRLKEFKILGRPILIGTSRKSFIGRILNVEPQERIFGTVASCVLAAKNGAQILRVHDVREVKQALKIFDAANNI